MSNVQIALTAFVTITLVGHSLCAVHLVQQQKKAAKPAAAWALAALFFGLITLAYYRIKKNGQS